VLSDQTEAPMTYNLPSNLPADVRLGFEVRNDEEVVTRRSLYLLTGFSWHLNAALAEFDGLGRLVAVGEGIAGAAVPGAQAEPFVPDLLRTPGLSHGAPRIYFVGRNPGQIAVWPAEPFPEWEPVWAVPFGRRGNALYCGASLGSDTPLPETGVSKVLVKTWRQLLWHWRKRITPPREPALRALWTKYGEAARDA
jgi:hypothetical protein